MSQLWYINKVKLTERVQFEIKLRYYSALLRVNPNWLMFIMNYESAGTFSPSKRNPYTNGVGLIQFMPSTAASLGTSTTQLASMSATSQLWYVYQYFKPKAGKYKSGVDLYLYTFYPYAVGKPDSYIIGIEEGLDYAKKVRQQNPSLSVFHNDTITLGEWKIALNNIITKQIPESNKNEFYGTVKTTYLLPLILLTTAVTLFYYKNQHE